MHYQVLARKWRPKQFNELIGQPHIVRTLKNSLLQKRIAQAYLLAGTRGVGKTTVARIFAKAIRCENLSADANPCNECKSCLDMGSMASMDIIEIDGASHNGVENIRTLIDNVQYLPTSGKYKVYVIDEVHMLSVSAFNALLKTLEEPPEHVIFIFATTDPDKLLKTVLSRCQRLDFRNVQEQDLVAHIEKISSVEGIEFENKNLIKELANLGKGSVRDSLSLLDQLLSMSENKHVTEEVFSLALGVAKESQVKEIVENLFNENTQRTEEIYNDVFKNNVDLKSFCSQVSGELFSITQSDEKRKVLKIEKDESFWVFEAFNKEISWGIDSLHPREVILLIFQKLALRGEFFAKSEKKKLETSSTSNSVTEKKKTKKKFIWNDFVKFVEGESIALAENLKRAILINESEIASGALNIKVSYVEGDEVLFGFVNDKSNLERLSTILARYIEDDSFEIELSIMSKKDKTNINEKSIEEIAEVERVNLRNNKEKRIKENEHILEAQKLFGTQIDKLIIKE